MFRTMSRDPEQLFISLARLAGHKVRRETMRISGQEVECIFISDKPENTIDMEEILRGTDGSVQ